MEKYPGKGSKELNPLKLNKKVWYLAECQKFLSDQEPSEAYNLRKIASNLWCYQKRSFKLSYSECNQMVKDHFNTSVSVSVDSDTSGNDIDERNSDEDDSEVESETEEPILVNGIDADISDLDESDETASDRDMFTDDEDVEVKSFLAVNQIEDLVKKENDLPNNIVKSRYYRRAKKKYFVDVVESKSVFEVLSQLTQVPEAVSQQLIEIVRWKFYIDGGPLSLWPLY
jgi:hypothetical protein